MKLSISDYKKILKFYKLSIPKKSKNIRKKAEKIIADKFCSCIKKVQQKFKKEGIAIGICTKSVINRKGYKRSTFRCKKRRTIKLQKGGSGKKKKGIAKTDAKGLPEYPYIQIDNPPKEWKLEGGKRRKKTRKKKGGKLDYMWDNMYDHFLGVGNGIENTLNNLSKLKYDSSEKDKDRIETKQALLDLSNEIKNIKENQIEWGKIIKDTTLSRHNLRQKLETLQSSEKAKYRWPDYSETTNGSPPRPTIEQADIINTKIKELLQPHQQHAKFKVASRYYKKNRSKIKRATKKKISKGYGQRLGIILEGGKRRKKTRKKKGGFNWFFQRDGVVLSNKPKRKSIYGEPHPLRFLLVDPRDNDDFDEDRTDGFSISFPFWGGKRRKKTRKKRGGDLELKQIHVNDLNQDAVGKYFKFTTRSNTGVIKVFDGKFLGYRLDRGILKAIFRIIKPWGELYVRLGQFVEIFKYVAETDTDNHTLEFIFANPQQGGRRKKKSRKKRGGINKLFPVHLLSDTGKLHYASNKFIQSRLHRWWASISIERQENIINRQHNHFAFESAMDDLIVIAWTEQQQQQQQNQQGGRKKKTRKKRGKGGVFSCKGCGDKKKKKERDFYYEDGVKKYFYDSDYSSVDYSDISDEDLKSMEYYEKESIKEQPNKRPVSPLLSEKEQQDARLSPTFGQFAKIETYKGGKRRKKTRKKRGGVMDEKDLIVGRIYRKDLSQGLTANDGYAKIVGFKESVGYKWVEAKLGTETNNLQDQKVVKIQRDLFMKFYKTYEFTPNTSPQDGAGKRRLAEGGHHLYKRLGVSKYASKKQIKKAYNNLKGNRKSTKKLREAYKILSNKKTRKQYNNKYREAMKK